MKIMLFYANENTSALWVEMIWNRRIHFKDINLFSMSSGASDWASERTNDRSGAQMSERCERMSVRTSEWLSTLRVDFIIIQSRTHRWPLGLVDKLLYSWYEVFWDHICIVWYTSIIYKGQKIRNGSSGPHRGCCKLPWLPQMVLGRKVYQMPFQKDSYLC